MLNCNSTRLTVKEKQFSLRVLREYHWMWIMDSILIQQAPTWQQDMPQPVQE